MKLFSILLLIFSLCLNLPAGSKKLEFEVSAGYSLSKPSELYYRATGIGSLVQQYTSLYGADFQREGEFKENLPLIPIQLSVNYPVANRFYVKAGLEYASGQNSGEVSFSLPINGLTENHVYGLENKISYLMPFVGAETRVSSAIGLYVLLGLNMANYSHAYRFDYAENGYTETIEEAIDVSGSTMAVLIGGKYMIKVGKRGKLLLKAEYLYAKLGGLSGDKTRTGSNSLGGRFSETVEGVPYTFRMDPYGLGSFLFWDLYETEPGVSWIQNIREMSLDISSIRFMVGFSF
jgi:hypothetical protein